MPSWKIRKIKTNFQLNYKVIRQNELLTKAGAKQKSVQQDKYRQQRKKNEKEREEEEDPWHDNAQGPTAFGPAPG